MAKHITGSIDPSLIGEYKNISYPDRRQFPSDDTVNQWKSLGHLYVNYTGFLREQHKGLPAWCHTLLEKVCEELEIENASMSLYCMPPGTIMPEHRDTYPMYKKINNIDNIDDICRVLVFLDNWKSGHYFELDDDAIINWKKGDFCMWYGDTPHIAANIGRENRYTIQITATVKK